MRNCYQERWHEWNRDEQIGRFICEKCPSSTSYHHSFVPFPSCEPKFPKHCFDCCSCGYRCKVKYRHCPRFCVVRSNCCAPRICCAEKNGRCITDIRDNYYMNLNLFFSAY